MRHRPNGGVEGETLNPRERPDIFKVSVHRQEKNHERIIRVPHEEVGGQPPHHSSHNAGGAPAPGAAILADVIYGSVSLGRRWSERAQQGLPLDVQVKGFEVSFFFLHMCLDFCLPG